MGQVTPGRSVWAALAGLLSSGGRVGSPLDRLQQARKPAQRLLGGTYRAGAFPVWIGPGRCRLKGHRPVPKVWQTDDGTFAGDEAWKRAELCSRCHGPWQFPDPPAPKPSGPGMKARA